MVEEGLKIDKESVLNSSEYETWKRKWLFLVENEINESIKMTQNWFLQKNDHIGSQNKARSECESDIDRLKSEIAELKSDLATCRSQAELNDL